MWYGNMYQSEPNTIFEPICYIYITELLTDAETLIPKARGVCLATLFTRGMLYHANEVVGEVVERKYFLNLYNFDGPKFQLLYSCADVEKSTNSLHAYITDEERAMMQAIYDFVTSSGQRVKK